MVIYGADLNAMRERLSAVRLLRAGIYDYEVHQAFFGLDEAADSFTPKNGDST